MKYKLKFQHKSNEFPWFGEFTSTREMIMDEALKWYHHFCSDMNNYVIMLYNENDMMIDNQGNRSIFDDVDA